MTTKCEDCGDSEAYHWRYIGTTDEAVLCLDCQQIRLTRGEDFVLIQGQTVRESAARWHDKDFRETKQKVTSEAV
jgi:hypothetical protein